MIQGLFPRSGLQDVDVLIGDFDPVHGEGLCHPEIDVGDQHFRCNGDREIDSFYTDSYNDQAMMDISKKVYLIKNGKGKRIK